MTPAFKTSVGQYTVKKFKSGEVQVQLHDWEGIEEDLVLEGSILSSDNLMELCQVVEAYRFYIPGIKILLIMPYCAYSRQDRRCNEGESFSLKVFANIINSLNFHHVITYDNHSEVSTALLDNCSSVSVKDLLDYNSDITFDVDLLVSPDAGANKKIQACSSALDIPFIRADKLRSTTDNSLSETIVYTTAEELDGKTLLIVDDICDGGRTFAALAQSIKKIQPNCTINLFITHGFFTYGIDHLYEAGISKITSSTSVSHYHNIPESDTFKLQEFRVF